MTAVRCIDTSAYCKLQLSDFRSNRRIRNNLVGDLCLACPYGMQFQTSKDDLLLTERCHPSSSTTHKITITGMPCSREPYSLPGLAELLMAAIYLPPRATSHFPVSLVARDAPKPDNGHDIQHTCPLVSINNRNSFDTKRHALSAMLALCSTPIVHPEPP
jgi:hypothetical protein